MKYLFTTLSFIILFTVQGNAQMSTYELPEGYRFTATTIAEQEIVQTIMGNDQIINSVTTNIDTYELVSATTDSYTFSTTTESIETNVSTPMGEQSMGSEGPNTSAGLKAMTGKSFEFTISKTGEILSITGLDEIIEAVESELNGSPEAAMSPQLLTQLTKEAKRFSIGSLFPEYPGDNADEWKSEQETVINGAPTSIQTTFSRTDAGNLKSRSNIEVSGEVSQMGMKVNLNLSGLMNTDFTINSETGLPDLVTSLYDLAGFVMAQGMEIPMSMSTNTTITVD